MGPEAAVGLRAHYNENLAPILFSYTVINHHTFYW